MSKEKQIKKEPLSAIVICKTTTAMKNKLLAKAKKEGFRDLSDYLRKEYQLLITSKR